MEALGANIDWGSVYISVCSWPDFTSPCPQHCEPGASGKCPVHFFSYYPPASPGDDGSIEQMWPINKYFFLWAVPMFGPTSSTSAACCSSWAQYYWDHMMLYSRITEWPSSLANNLWLNTETKHNKLFNQQGLMFVTASCVIITVPVKDCSAATPAGWDWQTCWKEIIRFKVAWL